MIITIDVPDLYVPVLSRWASVSRTLDTAIDAADTAASLSTDEHKKERFGHCSTELVDIRAALDALHHAARNEMWARAREAKEDKEVSTPKELLKELEQLHTWIQDLLDAGDFNERNQSTIRSLILKMNEVLPLLKK
jgi:hypothetical protein